MRGKGGKCSAAVIQNVKGYIKEAEQQLCNKKYYKMLDSGPVETHEKLVDQAVN